MNTQGQKEKKFREFTNYTLILARYAIYLKGLSKTVKGKTMKKIELSKHQKIIHDEMLKHPRYAAFLPTGAGKTLMTLEVLKNINKKTLIVAPSHVIQSTWAQEIKKWGYDITMVDLRGKTLDDTIPTADIYITTPETLIGKKFQTIYPQLKFEVIVLDESSKFKNVSSKRTKWMRKECRNFKHCYLLTATPAPRSLENLWPQFYFVDFGERLESTITNYRRMYFMQVGPVEYSKYEILPGASEKIYRKIEDRAKSVKVNNGKVLHSDVIVLPTPKTLSLISDTKNGCVKLDPENKIHIHNIATKLIQVSSGFLRNTKAGLSVYTGTEKLIAAVGFVEAQQGSPVLIGCNYTPEIIRLKDALKGYTVETIAGGMAAKKTKEIIEKWNQKKIDVLICQCAAVAYGLNMQYGGHTLLWFSPTLDPELYVQFNGRLDRPGQTEQVEIHHLVMRKSNDKMWYERLTTKTSIQDALLSYLSGE